jgi:hypothetical protein
MSLDKKSERHLSLYEMIEEHLIASGRTKSEIDNNPLMVLNFALEVVEEYIKQKDLNATDDPKLHDISKDRAVHRGYEVVRSESYKLRRVFTDRESDSYYSGWMDCFDWLSNLARK